MAMGQFHEALPAVSSEAAKERAEKLKIVRIPISRDGAHGYVNQNGKEVIPCQYRRAELFSEGLAAVKTGDERWQYIDKSGKEIFEVRGDMVGDFHDGMAWVREFGKYYFIDKSGKRISREFMHVDDFREGLALVHDGQDEFFIDKAGNQVTSGFQHALPFSEGLAVVQTNNDEFGYINKEGKMVFAFAGVKHCRSFNEGLAFVIDRSGRIGFVNKEGKKVLELDCEFAGDCHDGMILTRDQAKRYSFVSADGEHNIGDFVYATDYHEGIASVEVSSSRYSFIDKTGNLLHNKEYSQVGDFSEGVAWVRDGFESYYVDKTGNQVSRSYDFASDFHDGIAFVEVGNEAFYVNKKWQKVADKSENQRIFEFHG